MALLDQAHHIASAIGDYFVEAIKNPSAVVALFALLLSCIAYFGQRKHNRLSVRPLAYIMFGDWEDEIFVKVVNNGTGPMIIESITVLNARGTALQGDATIARRCHVDKFCRGCRRPQHASW